MTSSNFQKLLLFLAGINLITAGVAFAAGWYALGIFGLLTMASALYFGLRP
jgi:hypothetical protein